VAVCISRPHGANTGNEAEVVDNKNQQERGTKEPESAFDQVFAENITEKVIEPFDEPLGQVLNTTWNERHFLSSNTTERDDNERCEPNHDHGV